jgi:hypothetical protein
MTDDPSDLQRWKDFLASFSIPFKETCAPEGFPLLSLTADDGLLVGYFNFTRTSSSCQWEILAPRAMG